MLSTAPSAAGKSRVHGAPATNARKEEPLSNNLPQNEVVADLERIFKPLDGRALVPAFHYDADAKQSAEPPNRKWRRRAFIAPVLLIVTVAALAVAYEHSEPVVHPVGLTSVERQLPGTVQTISPLLTYARATPQVGAPVSTASTKVLDQAQRSLAVKYQPAVIDHSTQRPGDKQSASAGLVPALPLRTAPALASTSSNLVRQSSGTNTITSNPPIDEYRTEVDARVQCLPNSSDDRCIYQDVMNADTRLRRSFDRAVQGGVSRPALSFVLRKWNQARRQATTDPDQTINRYDQLVNKLDREPRGSPK